MSFEQTKEVIEITFKLVMILASLGFVVSLFKKIYSVTKEKFLKFLFRFNELEKRLEKLENKNKRKPKTKIKQHENKKQQ